MELDHDPINSSSPPHSSSFNKATVVTDPFTTPVRNSNSSSPKQQQSLVQKKLKRSFRIYCDNCFKCFFRRLTFTPDGALLITPSGQYQTDLFNNDDSQNTGCLYLRNMLDKSDDGNTLVVTSFDGYCSIVTFEEGELGERYLVVEEKSEFPNNGNDNMSEPYLTSC
ncbi:5106_t:CDS:2 [Entrophospora sp. SA101]|nr:5106_t:CDS:2 [Entrophospora sp. SA101]